ncbi:MAG: MBL fold metallo-hydrolase [Chloroflexota bacterium]
MDITWYGKSCIRLRGRDVTIIADPYDRTAGYAPLKLTGDAVSVSDVHPHRSAVESVTGERKPRVIDGPGEYEIAGAMISGVATYRDAQKGQARGKNTAFLFTVDDVTVCHLGAIGHTLNAEQIDALKDADVLLIPVGGEGMIDAGQAVEVVSQLEPKIVIPIEHSAPDSVAAVIEKFCKDLAATEVAPVPRLQVTRSSLPEETQVVLLAAPEPRR